MWRTIVGVVGDVRQMGLDVPARPEIYIPYRQFDSQPWFAPRDLAVRTTGDPLELVTAIKQQIHAVDPAQPISNIRTFDEVLDEEVAARRVGTTTLVAFATFALVLAVLGIYGVIAYFVVQHVPEIGVRLALGAQPRDIMTFIVGKGMTLAAIGVGAGALAALATARLMSSLLAGVSGRGLVMSLSRERASPGPGLRRELPARAARHPQRSHRRLARPVRALVGIRWSAWAPRRPPGQARGARIPGVWKRRATPPGGMHRRPRWPPYSDQDPKYDPAEGVMQVSTYLSFTGQCEAAFKFYERCLGGQLGAIFRYAGSPMADDAPAGWGTKSCTAA